MFMIKSIMRVIMDDSTHTPRKFKTKTEATAYAQLSHVPYFEIVPYSIDGKVKETKK